MSTKEVKYILNVFPVPKPFVFFNLFTRQKNYSLPLHSHTAFHVNYITDGSVDIKTPFFDFTVGAGCAFVMPAGVMHELYSQNGYSQIGMDIELEDDRYGIYEKLCEICSGKPIAVRPDCKGLEEIITVENLMDTSGFNALKCVNVMTSLVISIVQKAGENKASVFKERFTKVLSEYKGGTATLSELCKNMGFSKTHLERLVKKEFGCSAIEYFERHRLSKVCSLLASTDKKLAVIADECGFCDSSHLSVFFKKRSGITCARYRKLAR